MPEQRTPASAAGEWMGKIADLFSSSDKNLDQVKKSVQTDLEKLKRSTDTGASLYVAALAGFKKDLEEIGVRDDKQSEFLALFKQEWDKMEMGKKSAEILGSPELAAMDAFITKIENLPKLRPIIESAEPQNGWQNFLSGIAGKVPGLDQFIKGGGFDTILSALGLGFLVKKKDDKAKQGDAAQPAKPQGPEAKDKPTGEPDKNEGSLERNDVVPTDFKPGKTLVMGDSNNAVLTADPHKPLRDRLNITQMLAKGGMQSGWGVEQIKAQPDSYFAEFEYAAIGFGSNDMGSRDSAETIWGRLKEIATVIKTKNPKIKILIATIPPGKGNPSGEWGTNFEGVEKRRDELNKLIKKAKEDGFIAGVIDLAAPKSQGGLADDNDPHSLAREYRRFKDDLVHAKAEILAEAILRGQYRARTVTQTA